MKKVDVKALLCFTCVVSLLYSAFCLLIMNGLRYNIIVHLFNIQLFIVKSCLVSGNCIIQTSSRTRTLEFFV